MGRWTDIAEWRGPTINEGDGDGRPNEPEDRAVECRGCLLHIADGYYEGTISWQKNPAADVSSQFVTAGPRDVPRGTPDGKAAQVVDTDIRAWTQQAGNGHWVSIECSGFSGDALSPAQIETCARIFAKAHLVYGVPLQLATSPNGRGLGHHSMGTNGRQNPTDTWTGPTWGHELCPGPAIVAQKPAILARAIQIVNGVPAPPQQEEDDMTRVYRTPDKTIWVANGGFAWPVSNDAAYRAALAETATGKYVDISVDALPGIGYRIDLATSAVLKALTDLTAAVGKLTPGGPGAAVDVAAVAKAVNDDAAARLQS